MSRGTLYALGAGARKGLVLFWTALFLCSLLLQYVAIAAPSPVLAVHDEGLFELDGNVENGAAAGDDWNAVYNHTDSAFQTLFVNDPYNGNDPFFSGGDSKDIDAIGDWAWTTNGQPQDKNDIEHAYAAGYHQNGDLIVYFGLDRYASDGDAQVGFWFTQGSIGLTGGPSTGTFVGSHKVGDVLVQIDFENGGTNPIMRVYEWVGSGGNTSGTLDLVTSGGSCATTAAGDTRCAIANTGSTNPAWPYDDKSVKPSTDDDIPAGGMVEGGINLTQLGLDGGCFASFIAETRSSQSPTATLSDFAFGGFSLCSTPDLRTRAQQDGQNLSTADTIGTINMGESATDHAVLTGDSGTVEGTVKFYVCGPNANGAPDCSSGGDKVGATKTLSGGEADSGSFTPTQTGYYCFRAEYTPADGSKYLATSHSNQTTECFRVIPAGIDLVKTADDGTVNAGDQIGFTVSISSTGPGTAYGVKVSDTLPADPGLSWSIESQTGSWDLSGGVLSFGGTNGVTMAKNAEYHVHIVSPTTAATCGTVHNTADATTSNDGTDSDGASVVVDCPDIKVTKTPDGGSVSAGDTATFTIKVQNVGDGTAHGVTVSDDLPAGLHWTESEADCSISGPDGSQVLSCDVGTLAAGDSVSYSVSAVTSKASCGTIDNTASAEASNEPSGALGNNSDDGSIDVLCARIDIAKTADDGTVNAGDQIGFTVTVSNQGGGTAYGVSASDTLPDGFDWSIELQDGGWSIANGDLSWSAASLAPGASSSVHIVADTGAESCGVVDNTATVTTTSDGSDEDSASVTVQCPDVTIDKSADNSPINAGDTASFTITASNVGDGTAYDVSVVDVLPAGIAWTDDSDACDIVAGTLSCDFGDLATGESASVTVSGTTSPAVCGTVHNEASVSASNEPEANLGNNTDDADVVVSCPDIHVVKSAVSTPISAGDTAAFTITVSNDGPGVAYGVTLTDDLPAGVAWSDDSDACDIASGTLSCDFGDLAPGASASVTVSGVTDAPDCGTIHNLASATATNESQVDAQDNSDDADVVVQCPDIHVTKTADNSPISAGDVASYTITVSNDGPGRADDVTLEDTLPAGITWTDDSASCDVANGVLSCDFGTLASGASRTVTVSGETTARSCGVLPNTATATASNESEQDALDNSGSAEIVVDCPDIVITKTADDPNVSAGEQIGFVITVTNNGAGVARGVTVSDTLPTDPGTAWTIDANGSDDGWSIANGMLGYGPADLASGASVSVHIVSDTTPATCGVVENSADVSTTNDGSDEDGSTIDVNCPDVRLTKTADNSPILAGAAASFTIEVTNDGPGTAFDVVVTDTLPAGFAWTDDSEACSIDEGVLTCDLGDLAPGDTFSATVSSPTTVEDCGTIPNTASVVASNEPESATGNNTDGDEVDVLCASIDLVKLAGDAPDGGTLQLEQPGDVEFTYLVTNTGTADLVNVVLVDDNATPGDPSDDVTVECPKTSLAAGTSMICTATLPVGYGKRTNIATVTANPVVDTQTEVSDQDDAVVMVPRPTPTPSGSVEELTPPATSTIDADGGSSQAGSGMLLLLVALAALALGVTQLTPSAARARRRSRRR